MRECEKTKYTSESQAKRARKGVYKTRRVNWLRAYQCPWCKWWHLTSQPKHDEPEKEA